MNLICRKEKLLDAIQTTSKAAANRSTLSILECLLLQADDTGICMIGNNLQIGIKYSGIEGEIIEEGAIALEARMFSDIVRKLPADEVLIKTNANQITIIKSGKSEFKILGLPSNEFPVFPKIEEGLEMSSMEAPEFEAPESEEPEIQTLELSSSVFRDMLKKTVFSIAGEDTTKPVFAGELFEAEDGILNLVASDTFRISHISCPVPNKDSRLNLIVPGKALNEIFKILPDEEETVVSIYATGKHTLFSFGCCQVISRVINGDFLKYRHSFNVKATTVVTVNRESLWTSLDRASLISTKETKKYPIRMNVGAGLMTISTNTEIGASYEEVDIRTEGEPLEIAFNPKYLLEGLKVMEEAEVSLHFTTPLNPVIITGDASHRYLVLPLRLKNER